ncbi:MAG: cell envelope integrity protein TolA [Candidatus Competibacterales bacterium]|nr:cell envelope integrity protein TolA [Candidatus Competibacterales bacterium]
MRGRWRRYYENTAAVVLALLVHAVLAWVLLGAFGVIREPAQSRTEEIEPIAAVVIDESRIQAEAERLAEAERRRRAELERQRAEAERAAREAEQRRQVEEQRRLEEQRRAEEAARKAREAEERRKAEEAARKAREAEERRQAEEARALEEARQQLAESLRRAARDRTLQSTIARYTRLIRQQVERHWLLPLGSSRDQTTILNIRLDPAGNVIQVQVVRSSGDRAFDRSAVAAVQRASPLPLPDDPEARAELQAFNFKFNPED